MPVLTEPPSMGDVLKYEVNPNYTREVVTLLAGMPYPVGAVLGRITASGKYKLATSGGTDGAQTASAVLLYLPVPRIEIPGPQGIQASFDWQAARATSPARMCTAVLVNTVTGY